MVQMLGSRRLIANSSCLRYLLAVVLLMVIGLTCVGCDPAEPAPLRIGVSPWPGHAFVYLAHELGYFEEEGCEIRLLSFSSLADAQRAYFRNQLHGIYGTNVELLQACTIKGQQPCAVHITDLSHGGDVILADPAIKSVSQLRGRRVGCEPGSVSMYVLTHALAEHGMTLDDVDLVLCDQHEQQRQYAAGELAAVVAYPPVSHTIDHEHGARPLYCTRHMPGQVVNLLFVQAIAAQEREEDLAGLIRAFDRAVAYAAQYPDKAAQMMAPHLLMTPESVRQFLDRELRMVTLAEQPAYLEGGLLEDALANSAATLLSSGQLSCEVDVAACLGPGPARLAAAPPLRQPGSLAGTPTTASAAAANNIVPANLPLTPPIP